MRPIRRLLSYCTRLLSAKRDQIGELQHLADWGYISHTATVGSITSPQRRTTSDGCVQAAPGGWRASFKRVRCQNGDWLTSRNRAALSPIQTLMDLTDRLFSDHFQQVMRAAYRQDPESWVRFARCRAAIGYTAGAVPLRRPGDPVGWAIILLGFADRRDLAHVPLPPPLARLDLSGRIAPPRPDCAPDPATSQAVSLLAALALVRLLGEQGWHPTALTLWTPPPSRRRAGSTGPQVLAPQVEQARSLLAWVVTHGITLQTGTDPQDSSYQAAVAHQATEAALGFAEPLLRLHPTEARLGTGGPDYILVIAAPLSESDGVGYYSLQARDGRRREGSVVLTALRHPEEGTYRTLIAALTELLERIRLARRNPRDFQVQIILAAVPVLLRLAQRTGSVADDPPGTASVRRLLARFGRRELIGQPPAWIAAWHTSSDSTIPPPY